MALSSDIVIRCPNCGAKDLAGDTGDQVPQRSGCWGEWGHDICSYEWVDFTCRSCGHRWREEEQLSTAEELRAAGVPELFDEVQL